MTGNRSPVYLMVLSLLLSGACIILPVGHESRGKEIRHEDLAFIELGVTTKIEVVERLGKGLSFEEQNVIAYYWASETKFFLGTPSFKIIDVKTKIYRQNYALYIQFDPNDRVKRFESMMIPENGFSVMEWLESE